EELSHVKVALDNARATLQAAQAAVQAAKAQEQAQRDAVGKDIPLEQQPEVMAAASAFKEAWLAVQRTQVRAPVSGQVAKRNVQLGQQIGAGAPLMAIVPMNDLWVDVNFKETQLAKLKAGQEVELTSDFYGSDVKFKGTIQGLSAGTGSAFSLLPAQNATGNWIKVVQRVPVRVRLNPQELAAHPLRIGLSMHATVDTRNQSGDNMTNVANPKQPALSEDLSQADKLVADIIANSR
ncbi:HlyD family efflux transporter periplasmic adaptor subunit, partial [Kingella kingae]